MPTAVRIPERRKQPGLCYAVTNDGIELPVIDVTHPAFAFSPTPEALATATRLTLEGFERGSRWPAFVMRLAARRSVIMRNVLGATGSYLGGLATYLQKLGPDNVGDGWGGSLDRKLLRTIGPISMRLRLRDMSELLAAGIAARLPGGDRRPILFLNIGGGTGIDSLNALILLARRDADRLAGRRAAIDILDPDEEGPAFGARAMAALTASGCVLEGIDVAFRRHDYDWRNPDGIRAAWPSQGDPPPLVACSSEGGLFEYGSDEDVVGNLDVLRQVTPPDTFVVGSVLCDGVVGRAMVKYGRVALQLRTPESFRELANRAAWRVDSTIDESGIYHVVSLVKL